MGNTCVGCLEGKSKELQILSDRIRSTELTTDSQDSSASEIKILLKTQDGKLIGKQIRIPSPSSMRPYVAYATIRLAAKQLFIEYDVVGDPNPAFKGPDPYEKEHFVNDKNAWLNPNETYSLFIVRRFGFKGPQLLSVITEELNESRSKDYASY